MGQADTDDADTGHGATGSPGRRYADKAVVLTGAASGIGRATALRLSAEGARLLVVDRDADGLADTLRQVEECSDPHTPRPVPVVADVAEEQAVRSAVAAAAERFGRIDLLVNVAGALGVTPLADLGVDEWRRLFDVNALGTMLFCREALPHLIAAKGVVVNTASTAATHAHPLMTAYAASKGAVLAFTLSLAAEVAPHGVRAVAVSPGGIRTPMSRSTRFPEGADASYYRRIVPLTGSLGAPEEVAGTIAFAGSADAGFMNGVELRVDGGSHN
ncbi:NAD(P)-dependent dehydrogenase (short-subunit alcohol dehydrogenase family) [Nocardiopsis mwathae]|uniref:NAD(P)-dependent dehydrogenase (Short-subunit alcohol dehydrogenase family) n=1 Tax=Nocardiopsis mwathae TaxID=1472723 RepID=A0A7W9YL09_9ACTN|nr:SDR family oxidoreductase [Nocardiopsis mwathae]MBB6174118.1 NAD(P)-dependent dehydrogenase (short-subunit alcohol dehydrogenase family) [Nocardiopsis mwathae]